MSSRTDLDWKTVKSSEPCEICGSSDWCARDLHRGAALCRRVTDAEGANVKTDKEGREFALYFEEPPQKPETQSRQPRAKKRGPAIGDLSLVDKVYTDFLKPLTLKGKHGRQLAERRKLPEAAEHLGIVSTPSKTQRTKIVAQLFKRYGQDLYKVPGFYERDGRPEVIAFPDGWIVPYRDVESRIIALRVRLDKSADGKHYRWYSSGGKGGPSSGIHPFAYCPEEILLEQAVILTEGELKAYAAAEAMGVRAISLPGVDHLRTAQALLTSWSPGHVILAIDADRYNKRDVALAYIKIVEALTAEGREVESLTWWSGDGPDKDTPKGIDDALRAGQEPHSISGDELEAELDKLREIHGINHEGRDQQPEGEQPASDGSGSGTSDGGDSGGSDTGGEPGGEDDDPDDERPVVYCPGGRLRAAKRNLTEALATLGEAKYYHRAGGLVTVENHEIRFADADSVTTEIVEYIKFEGKNKYGDIVEKNPPTLLTAALRSRPAHFGLGEIRYLTTSPIILPCGRVTMDPGYYPESGVFYTGLVRCNPVPETPTAEQVRQAAADLWYPFQEFPFVDRAADWANLVAMMLVLVARLLFVKIPPWMATANNPGTGKGLVIETAILVATGEISPVTIWDEGETELRKSITTYLREFRKFIFWDNVNHHIDSASFCALSTATKWRDRLLGGNSSATLDCLTLLALAANNPSASKEVLRRFVYVCLRADSESPETQNQKRRWVVELPNYVQENQANLITSLLTLWRAWFAAGKPMTSDTHVSYEDFSRRIGGVLQVAGIPGFLGNAEKMRSVADPETVAWRGFVAAWSRQYGTTPVTTSQLHALCVYDDPEICHSTRADRLLPEVLGASNERSQRTRLGRALGKMRDRIFGDWRITKLEDLLSGKTTQYALTPAPGAIIPDLSARPERPDVRKDSKRSDNRAVLDFRTLPGRADNVRREI